MAMAMASRLLFGSNEAPKSDSRWKVSDWTSSDDTVRGGASFSRLQLKDEGKLACFNGNLDIDTLGGAAFASQRTVGDLDLDLGKYDGLRVVIDDADLKQYTLILKDESLPKSNNGREQATISWEHTFKASISEDEGMNIEIPWRDFEATYRGKKQTGVKPLNTSQIKSVSIMARSMFGAQSGSFSLTLKSISAYKEASGDKQASLNNAAFPYPYSDSPNYVRRETAFDDKRAAAESSRESSHGMWGAIRRCFGRL